MQNRPLRIAFAGRHVGRGDFPRHHHDVWELVYVSDGAVVTYQEDCPHRLTPGMVLVNPPGVVHHDVFVRPYHLIYLFVEGSVLERCGRILYDSPDQSLGRVFDNILREWGESRADREAMLGVLAAQLELLILRQPEERRGSERESWLIEAERLLRDSVGAPMTLEEVAERVGVSRSWLHHAFKQAYGRSPHEHVSRLRLEKALALLRLSSHTVAFIAEECGYASGSHLTTHLKKVTGQSPTRIREA